MAAHAAKKGKKKKKNMQAARKQVFCFYNGSERGEERWVWIE
jgi:hypothetical protein